MNQYVLFSKGGLLPGLGFGIMLVLLLKLYFNVCAWLLLLPKALIMYEVCIHSVCVFAVHAKVCFVCMYSTLMRKG